jgi:hypothetical protein
MTSDSKPPRRTLPRKALVALGVVCLGAATAAAIYGRRNPEKVVDAASIPPAADAGPTTAAARATMKVPVYRLECGFTEDGKPVVLGRSYNRGAMEALARKTARDAKTVTPGVCEIKESIATVPTGPSPRRADAGSFKGPVRPSKSLPLKAPRPINR